MNHLRLFAAMAVLCLLVGSAYAVAKLMPAVVDEKKCLGCEACTENCPVGAISGEKKAVHAINSETCIKCGACLDVCPDKFKAIIKEVAGCA